MASKKHRKMIPTVIENVSLLRSPTWLNHSKYCGFRAFRILERVSKKGSKNASKRAPKWSPSGAQIDENGAREPSQKNSKKMVPKMHPNWPPRASQNGAKTVKNEVLEASCFKVDSQVASRPRPGSVLERFGHHFGTSFTISGRSGKQHVANREAQNHKGSSKKSCWMQSESLHGDSIRDSFCAISPVFLLARGPH